MMDFFWIYLTFKLNHNYFLRTCINLFFTFLMGSIINNLFSYENNFYIIR